MLYPPYTFFMCFAWQSGNELLFLKPEKDMVFLEQGKDALLYAASFRLIIRIGKAKVQ